MNAKKKKSGQLNISCPLHPDFSLPCAYCADAMADNYSSLYFRLSNGKQTGKNKKAMKRLESLLTIQKPNNFRAKNPIAS